MKRTILRGMELSNESGSFVILELPGKKIKILANNDGLLEELKLSGRLTDYKEAVKKTKEVLRIEAEERKVYKSKEFKTLSPKEVFKVEETFDKKIEKAWL